MTTTVYSVPSFYGAHGHDSNLRSMSAIFYVAGPSLTQGRKVDVLHDVDVVPTVLDIVEVAPSHRGRRGHSEDPSAHARPRRKGPLRLRSGPLPA
jgi:hypothetical protein